MAHKKTILFPTDFSHAGDAALEMATGLAKDRGMRLLIVHVEEPPPVYGMGEMYYGTIEPDVKELEQMLSKVVPSDPAVPYEHRLIKGDPAGAILQVARDEGVEMIVMSTHGRTGIGRLLMGSIAEAVVRRAECPVLTYRHPHKMRKEAD